jgi:hypothetical protein
VVSPFRAQPPANGCEPSGLGTRPKTGHEIQAILPLFGRPNIDPELGIEAKSFDKTIENMNRIQEAILFSEEEQEACSI